MATSRSVRTREQANEWFRETGTPVAEWAKSHGFAPEVVYALLNGRTRGRRGKAHSAAVALGLKSGSVAPEDSVNQREGQMAT